MSAAIIFFSVYLAQIILAVAMLCSLYRLVKGPRAHDRILAMDSLYLNTLLIFLTFGISTGSTTYFEVALIIALLGFVSTVALAKFLMRGEVIE